MPKYIIYICVFLGHANTNKVLGVLDPKSHTKIILGADIFANLSEIHIWCLEGLLTCKNNFMQFHILLELTINKGSKNTRTDLKK